MRKQLLNSVIAKYCDLQVSHRSNYYLPQSSQLRQIIDLLTTYKSQYFAQPRPILVNSPYPFPLSKEKFLQFNSKFILCQGGTAVDAVELAVRSLEDDPTFDAGHGSVLTEELIVEVDAMIMDGNTLESGTKVICFIALIVSNLLEVQWSNPNSGPDSTGMLSSFVQD